MVRSDDLRVQIALMDRNGNQIKSTLARSNQRTVNIADRPHFRAQLDPSRDDLYISNPVIGRGSGEQTIQFTRKVMDSAGAFNGVAVLSLGCAQISEFYETSEVGDGFVALRTTEGVLLARGPNVPAKIGASIGSTSNFQTLMKGSSGSLWLRGSSTGYRAYRQLSACQWLPVDRGSRVQQKAHLRAIPLFLRTLYAHWVGDDDRDIAAWVVLDPTKTQRPGVRPCAVADTCQYEPGYCLDRHARRPSGHQ